MADYHILLQDEDKRSIKVVFHIPVPAAGTNEANLTWRDAIVKEQGGSGSIVSVLPDIDAAEENQLKTGEIYEKLEMVRFSSKNLTPTERKAEIETRFNNLKNDLIQDKQKTLEWIGFQGNVS